MAAPTEPSSVDDEFYLELAQNLLSDASYHADNAAGQYHYRFAMNGPTSFWPPGYPCMVAALLAVFQGSIRAVFIAQALLGGFTARLVYRTGLRLADSRVAAVASVIYSFDPYSIAYTGQLMTETLAGLVTMGALLLGVEIGRRPATCNARKSAIVLGLVLGLGLLTRAAFAPITVAIFCVLLSRIRTRERSLVPALRFSVFCAVGVMVVMAPWLARNFASWGSLVYTTSAGHNLHIGFNEIADGTNMQEAVPLFDRNSVTEVTRDRILLRQVAVWILHHPYRAASLCTKRLMLCWDPRPRVARGRRWWVGMVHGCFFLGICLIGICRASRHREEFELPLALIVASMMTFAVTFVATRFRLPLHWCMAIFGAYALTLVNTHRARPRGRDLE